MAEEGKGWGGGGGGAPTIFRLTGMDLHLRVARCLHVKMDASASTGPCSTLFSVGSSQTMLFDEDGETYLT